MTSSLSRRHFIKGAAASASALTIEAAAATSAKEAATENIQVELNGEKASIRTIESGRLSTWLREYRALTGCKEACGQGVCGSCTVLVDGEPILSCLTPLEHVEGASVKTIEAYSDHPVQRAFAAMDALQCGYCTPGFIMEAIPFVEAWREQNGNTAPSRERIASEMAGHICRCGAYEGIYQAIELVCQGHFDKAPVQPPRAEAWEKVTGRAMYTTDVSRPSMLHGVVFRSPHSHAVIKSLRLDALETPHVHAIVSLVPEGGMLRYVGQPILAIACDSEQMGRALLRQIEMNCDVLPHVHDLKSAQSQKAVLVYPEDLTHLVVSSSEQPATPAPWSGNIRGPSRLDMFCRPEEARKKIDADSKSITGNYSSHVQSHCALEPHCALAEWRDDGGLNLWLSTQVYDIARDEIAHRFSLKPKQVDMISTHVGGGFGAKGSVQSEAILAIELSKKSNRPVKVVWSRPEEMLVGGSRSCADIRVELSGNKRSLRALSMKAYNGSGVSVGGASGMQARLLYPAADKEILDYDVLTHMSTARAFRGPGAPGALWALEQSVDEFAIREGVDPISLRMTWDKTPQMNRLGLWAKEHPLWLARENSDNGRFRRGVGVAIGAWAYMLNPQTEIELDLNSAGDLIAKTRSQDIGNGSRSVIQWALAEAFSIARSRITVVLGEESKGTGPGSFGSQTTASLEPAVVDAANRLKESLKSTLGGVLNPARILDTGLLLSGKTVPWGEVLKMAGELHVLGRRPRDPDGYMLRFGPFAIGHAVSRGLQLYEVEVDRRLGGIRVTRGALGIAAGRIVCEPLATSQALGGMIQGISYTLYEEKRIDPGTGRPISLDLNHYKIAGMADMPQLEVHFDQEPLPRLPNGVCGISELCTVPSAAAIGNAFFNATGKRATRLPLTPDRLLGLLS